MTDFFTALGSSNILAGETSRLSDLVLTLRKQKMEEARMGLESQRADLERQNVTSQIAERNVDTAIKQQTLASARAQRKYLDTSMPLDQAFSSGVPASPSARKLQTQKMQDLGLLTNIPGTQDQQITNENKLKFGQFVEENPNFQKDVHLAIYNDSKQAEDFLQQKIANAKQDKLKPEEVQQLQKSLQVATQHRIQAAQNINLTDQQIQNIQSDIAKKQQEEPFKNPTREFLLSKSMDQNDPSGSARAKAILDEQDRRDIEKIKQGSKARESADIEATKLSPEAVTAAATRYNMTGQLPPVGMGKGVASQRKDILNEAAKQLKEQGLTSADAVMNQIKIKTTQTALNQLDKLRQYSNTFETRANGLFDTLIPMRAQIQSSGIKSVDSIINMAERKVVGTPEQVALADQVYEAMVDYGKVVSGQFSIAGMSDSARRETQQLLSASDKPETFERLVGKDGLFRKNMTLTSNSYDSTYNSALAKLQGKKLSEQSQKTSGIPPQYKLAPDGKYYAPDPARPGKFLMWSQ